MSMLPIYVNLALIAISGVLIAQVVDNTQSRTRQEFVKESEMTMCDDLAPGMSDSYKWFMCTFSIIATFRYVNRPFRWSVGERDGVLEVSNKESRQMEAFAHWPALQTILDKHNVPLDAINNLRSNVSSVVQRNRVEIETVISEFCTEKVNTIRSLQLGSMIEKTGPLGKHFHEINQLDNCTLTADDNLLTAVWLHQKYVRDTDKWNLTKVRQQLTSASDSVMNRVHAESTVARMANARREVVSKFIQHTFTIMASLGVTVVYVAKWFGAHTIVVVVFVLSTSAAIASTWPTFTSGIPMDVADLINSLIQAGGYGGQN